MWPDGLDRPGIRCGACDGIHTLPGPGSPPAGVDVASSSPASTPEVADVWEPAGALGDGCSTPTAMDTEDLGIDAPRRCCCQEIRCTCFFLATRTDSASNTALAS